MGYINKFIVKESVKLGFIGSIRNFNIKRPVKTGDVLHTSIEVVEEVMQMTLVNAVIKIDGDVVAETEMKIALTDIDAA
jgi:3-hydroxymyristoyl/3-hydroxydecanoyl-(acyl carrier protein) dehydratase